MIDTRGDDVARRWSLRLLAGLLAGAVVLTGCSEKQPANESLPTSTATPTEDELPPLGPEDLPMPDEARTQDAAGAEAFVRYYIELINRTSEVMDAEPLREFSEGCLDCGRVAAAIEEAADAGHDYQGGELFITELGEPLLEGNTAEFSLRVDQAELVVVDADGTPVDGGSESLSGVWGGAGLIWDPVHETWLITDLTFG